MLAYILRRLMWTPIVLLVVTFVTFGLGHYGPGDPVQVLMGQKNDPAVVERIRRERGLDKPFLEQYVTYVFGDGSGIRRGIIRGDFGESYKFTGQKVSDLIFSKIAVSAQLGALSLAIGVFIGIIFGLAAATNQGRWVDPLTISSGLLLSSLPVFIVQPILALVLSRQLHWLPSAGWEGILHPKVIMPALVMCLGPIGGIARLMRASTLEVINQDYVRTGRAKGLPESTVRLHYITRNSILPIFTVVGLSLASLVEGAFITETLFGIPGVGRLAVDAFFARDYPIIMAMTLLVAGAYVLANLLVDIGYTFLDPRIRLQ